MIPDCQSSYPPRKFPPNPYLRAIGYFLTLAGVGLLSWDFYQMMSGLQSMNGYLSSMEELLYFYDKQAMVFLENLIVQNTFPALWFYVLLPITKVPLAPVCFLPGIIMVRIFAPDIKVRGATKQELEMQALGMNPRHIHRYKMQQKNSK